MKKTVMFFLGVIFFCVSGSAQTVWGNPQLAEYRTKAEIAELKFHRAEKSVAIETAFAKKVISDSKNSVKNQLWQKLLVESYFKILKDLVEVSEASETSLMSILDVMTWDQNHNFDISGINQPDFAEKRQIQNRRSAEIKEWTDEMQKNLCETARKDAIPEMRKIVNTYFPKGEARDFHLAMLKLEK